MNILAFDTAFDACSVAVGRGLRRLTPAIATYFEPMNSGQAERLLPLVQAALADVGLAVKDLDRIAVTTGPGTFTGARIGVAAARALALVHGTPIVAITSLQLMAMNYDAKAGGAAELVIATDARRGEVYLERFVPRSLCSITPPAAMTIRDAAESLRGVRVAIAGSGAEALAFAAQELGIDAMVSAPDLLPDAASMLFAAIAMSPVAKLEPLYLRPPDAKPPAKAVISLRSAP